MDELRKGLNLGLTGPAADEALARFRRQTAAWGLVMPAVPPLVLDFGLGDFDRVGLIEYWIANEVEAGYCGKFLFVFAGQTCPLHQHREKMETFYVVRGEVTMTCADETRRMRAGDVLAVPPGRRHTFTGVGPALLLELSTPCVVADNRFDDQRIQRTIDALADGGVGAADPAVTSRPADSPRSESAPSPLPATRRGRP